MTDRIDPDKISLKKGLSFRKMIDEIMEVRHDLCNEWELNFIQNLHWRVEEEAGNLSEKQVACLERLYQKACDSDL